MRAELPRSFIDTNVFIYQLDATDPHKHAVARRIVRDALDKQNAVISYQVVQECLNVVTTQARQTLTAEQAQAWMQTVLAPLMQVGASTELFQQALAVRLRWGFSFYDSLIVAAALSAGCTTLLTEDLQHGQRIESLTVEDPFRV